jgi:hypothetical protein
MLNQGGASLTFSQIQSNLPVGTSVAALIATAKVNGDTLTAPVSVTANRDMRKLLFSETGVALSSTPGWSRLSRTVRVTDNFGLSSAWSASSDQPWLTISRSGAQLTLSANPSSLPADALSYATVTLSSGDAGVAVPEALRVAVWKGSTTPTAITRVARQYAHIRLDPIRPYLYAHNRGTAIDVYNVYTGAQIGSINNVGASLGDMSVRQNGDALYTFDTANRVIVVVDLRTMAVAHTLPMPRAVTRWDKLMSIRPNGVELLATSSDNEVYLASTGARVTRLPGNPMSVSSDGKRYFSLGWAHALDYSAMAGGTLFDNFRSYEGALDIAVNGDGTRLYIATGNPFPCREIDVVEHTTLATLNAPEYGTNIEVGSDGRVYCGTHNPGGDDVWIYRPDNTLARSYRLAAPGAQLVYASLGVTGDGFVMVASSETPELIFVPVGP